LEGIFKSIFEGILQGIINGFFKGIILVSLRVIDGGFCLGNEFLTLRRGLRHIRYIFLSDRLLELGIGYWVSGKAYPSSARKTKFHYREPDTKST
jgi:hypothetical protein